ncbi:hypothetical protein ACFL4A_03985 [bacterium]
MGSNIVRTYKRHILGRFFATLIGFTFKLKSYDTQCGAKLFHKSVINIVFMEPFISKWIFDIEIILRLKKYNVIEYPLLAWKDVKGSKLHLIRDFSIIIRDIIKLYSMYFTLRKS